MTEWSKASTSQLGGWTRGIRAFNDSSFIRFYLFPWTVSEERTDCGSWLLVSCVDAIRSTCRNALGSISFAAGSVALADAEFPIAGAVVKDGGGRINVAEEGGATSVAATEAAAVSCCCCCGCCWAFAEANVEACCTTAFTASTAEFACVGTAFNVNAWNHLASENIVLQCNEIHVRMTHVMRNYCATSDK